MESLFTMQRWLDVHSRQSVEQRRVCETGRPMLARRLSGPTLSSIRRLSRLTEQDHYSRSLTDHSPATRDCFTLRDDSVDTLAVQALDAFGDDKV